MLSTLQIAPVAGSNGVGDLRNALDYMRAAQLVRRASTWSPGTEPFNPDLVGAILGA